MSGERDLQVLIRGMRPDLRLGRFVFVTGPEVPEGVDPVAWVREDEGVTVILDQEQAEAHGLEFDFVAAMITLRVHSSLAAVGLTAAVSSALAGAGISCNVVSGFHHDHLFVPHAQGRRAARLLSDLAAASA
jgi:hypothetical protein